MLFRHGNRLLSDYHLSYSYLNFFSSLLPQQLCIQLPYCYNKTSVICDSLFKQRLRDNLQQISAENLSATCQPQCICQRYLRCVTIHLSEELLCEAMFNPSGRKDCLPGEGWNNQPLQGKDYPEKRHHEEEFVSLLRLPLVKTNTFKTQASYGKSNTSICTIRALNLKYLRFYFHQVRVFICFDSLFSQMKRKSVLCFILQSVKTVNKVLFQI